MSTFEIEATSSPVTIKVTFTESVVPPEPEPPAGKTYDFRAIYCRDEEFAQCYPNAFRTMGLSVMECYIYSGTTNLKKRMDQLQEPDLGWSILSSFTPSSSGGSFKLTDTDCRTVVQAVADHPRNSHVYYIADEPDLTPFNTSQQDANRNKLKARRDLIHAADPKAIVCLADYRQAQLDPAQSGRPGGMWKGIVDQVWLSGYPWPNAVEDPDSIPNQARWCEAAGVSYLFCLSCHDYQGSKPAYPTADQFDAALEQILQTESEGVVLYIWYDAEGTRHLSQDPPMQGHIGTKMAPLAGET